MTKQYGVVIAHKEGQATERVLPGRYPDMDAAQQGADAWTRKHGHSALGADKCGFYAYADRITRPAQRIYL